MVLLLKLYTADMPKLSSCTEKHVAFFLVNIKRWAKSHGIAPIVSGPIPDGAEEDYSPEDITYPLSSMGSRYVARRPPYSISRNEANAPQKRMPYRCA